LGLGNGRFGLFIGISALKHRYLFRSGRLGFGLKPDLKT